MNSKRLRSLRHTGETDGPVLYWMDRDRRAHDNWALIHAQKQAKAFKQPLAVLYVVPATFLGSTWRQMHFMLEGLKEVAQELQKKNIAFFCVPGNPDEIVPKWVKQQQVSYLVTDFSPLRIPRKWRSQISKQISIPFTEVDTRNIVPCWEASPKKEFGAYTIRPKIHRQLREYLDEFPPLRKHPVDWPQKVPSPNWSSIEKSLDVDRNITPVDWIKPGEKAAHRMLKQFLDKKRDTYAEDRNDPTKDALSNLSPYIHYGMISAQRIALSCPDMSEFLEELIVRRELADNFCFYEPYYDRFEGFPEWAQKTLNEHRHDDREYTYSLKRWEEANTHDELWNAAQKQLLKSGKMHGYMRMYWCKKILEWSKTPEEAMKIAITLNDKYELDGRDPNGYTGIAWSIGGVHDRAWTERPVYGKIRYMNANGCKRKFDVKVYIEHWSDKLL